MSRLRRAPLAVLALAAVAVPTAVAASPTSPSPSSSASATPSSSSSSSSQPASSGSGTHISAEKPFAIVLDSKGTPEASKLPTVSTLFTQKELAQVVPGLAAVRVSDDTQTLTIKGDSSTTIQVVLKRFGTKDSVTNAWKKEKTAHEKRAKADPGLYTFLDGSAGATDAFTDGTNTHVLVTSGDAAGEIWFSGCGFTDLASDYPSSRSAYKTKVVPALVRLIADKAAAGAKDEAKAQEAARATAARPVAR